MCALSPESTFFIEDEDVRLAAVLHHGARGAAVPGSLVVCAHGFTGYKHETGRIFVHLARALVAAGFSVLRFDFFGSGDSSGDFSEMTPMTEIRDLKRVVRWASDNGFASPSLLGFSFGGGVSIVAAAGLPEGSIHRLVTWCAVPSFRWWRSREEAFANEGPYQVGPRFFTDRPETDVPEAYCKLKIPKLQIQGDQDIEGFCERFAGFFERAPEPKRHDIISGADHVFTETAHRDEVIARTVDWFSRA